MDLYWQQKGTTHGSKSFPIERGVKQGDTLSSLLFNAVIEDVFERWKRRLTGEGWFLGENAGHLTNIRFADDILLFAKSLEDLMQMLTLLREELLRVGLEMHPDKSKIMTNEMMNTYKLIDIGDMFIEVLDADKQHKYLGRMISLHAEKRTKSELHHRLQVSWMKFHQNRK